MTNSTGRRRVADGAAGGGIGVVIVWVLDLLGVPITPAAAAVLASMIAVGAAALGRNGIKGIVHRLWSGVNGKEEEPEE